MRLTALETKQHQFCLVDVSEVNTMATWFGLPWPDAQSEKTINWLVTQVLSPCLKEISGVVVDPLVGYDVLSKLGFGRGAKLGVAYRLLEDKNQTLAPYRNWGVEETAANYGLGYVRLPYNPNETAALDKKKVLFELADYCQMEGIDLILYLQITGVDGGKIHPDDLPAAQLQAISELRDGPALMLLDHPGSQLNAATISAELDMPWGVALNESDYDQAKKQLRESLEGGAKGFMVGPVLWQELTKLRTKDMTPDKVAIQQYCETQLRDKVMELSRIVAENN